MKSIVLIAACVALSGCSTLYSEPAVELAHTPVVNLPSIQSQTVNNGAIFQQALPEDLLKFGLIPEFVGRLPVVAVVQNLDREALVRILVEPKNALIKQYRKFFEFEDVELDLTDDALDAVAEQALLRGTGARGLRAILEEVLLNTMYDLPGRSDIDHDPKTVREKVNPTLLPREAQRANRPRRAAS